MFQTKRNSVTSNCALMSRRSIYWDHNSFNKRTLNERRSCRRAQLWKVSMGWIYSVPWLIRIVNNTLILVKPGKRSATISSAIWQLYNSFFGIFSRRGQSEQLLIRVVHFLSCLVTHSPVLVIPFSLELSQNSSIC